jgi:hypothetical protein
MTRSTHTRIYRRLLNLHPAGVRAEFAGEMTLVFADSIRHAQRRGLGAVMMTWLRELRSLPSTLFQSHGGRGDFDRNTLAVSALAIVTASMFASRLVANLGLFFTISWVLLGAGLIAGGLLLGGGMRRAAGVVLLFAMTMPLFVDRALLATVETHQSIAAPGVRADVYFAPTDSAAKSFLAQMKASKTPRLRTVARSHGSGTLVTSVRAGGVDGAYVAMAMLLMIGSAYAGRRLATAT